MYRIIDLGIVVASLESVMSTAFQLPSLTKPALLPLPQNPLSIAFPLLPLSVHLDDCSYSGFSLFHVPYPGLCQTL